MRAGAAAREDEDADDVPELGWIAVDGDGLALADARRVQEAAMLAALCETAEEAALVPDAADIAQAAERALALAPGTAPSCSPRSRRRAGPRWRRPSTTTACASRARGYVDQLAAAAARHQRERAGAAASAARSSRPASAAMRSTLPSRSRAPSGTCSTGLRAAGAPERFSDALGEAAPAISAFAEDVLAHYRAELERRGGRA